MSSTIWPTLRLARCANRRRLSAAHVVICGMSKRASRSASVVGVLAAGVPELPEVGAALIGRPNAPEQFTAHLVIEADHMASIKAGLVFRSAMVFEGTWSMPGNNRSSA